MSPLPPQLLPENLWGDRWQFVGLSAQDLELYLLERPIPIRKVSELALPSQQQLSETLLIPGVVIDAGRQSMQLARWIAAQHPQAIEAINRELGALMLTAEQHTAQWILATYQDEEVRLAAQTFEERKIQSCGIHFLLIQPDNTAVTYSGLWILRA
jgi:RNA-binding protein Tab2/Atab2